jgi:hypothetical protein
MGFLDKLKEKAKDIAGAENFDKFASKAKELAETTKSAIHEATAPTQASSLQGLTPRQNTLVKMFSYRVSDGEKILFASAEYDIMLTNRAFLIAGGDNKLRKFLHHNAKFFSIYFAKNWRYTRFEIRDSQDVYANFDDVEFPKEEAQTLCRIWLNEYYPTKGDALTDGLRLYKTEADGWEYESDAESCQLVLGAFEKDCGFTMEPDEEVIFVGNGLVEFILTNYNLLIDMVYHPAYNGNNYRTVMSYEHNKKFTIQIEATSTPVHILIEDAGIADNIGLYSSETVDLIMAIGKYCGNELLYEDFPETDFSSSAVEFTLNPDNSIDGEVYDDVGEQYFKHPEAENFHNNNLS